MFEWINPWITGSLSVSFLILAIVLTVREVKRDRTRGPIETYNFIRSNDERVTVDLQSIGDDDIEVIRIKSDK